MLKLYRLAGATCAAKVLLALYEKEIPFEDEIISREDLATDWYRKLNPNAVVPTIIHNGEVIIESTVILNYLEDAFDGLALRPGNALQCARMNFFLKLADDALKSLGAMALVIFARQMFLSMSEETLETYLQTLPDVEERSRRGGLVREGLDSAYIPGAMAVLAVLQRKIDEAVQDGGYLVGDYSLADCAVTPFISRLSDLGLLASETKAPALHRWWQDIQARPSFKKGIVGSMPVKAAVAMRARAKELSDDLRPRLQAVDLL